MIELKRILLPTDFSEPALAASRYALEFARQFQAELHLLHVIEGPLFYAPAFGGYAPAPADLEQFAQTELDNWLSTEETGGLNIERRWVHGRPFLSIIEYAREHEIDLIVMGTHGYGFTAHILLGSVAEKVIRRAPCPVLTVRPHDFRYAEIGEEPQEEGEPEE